MYAATCIAAETSPLPDPPVRLGRRLAMVAFAGFTLQVCLSNSAH